MLKVTATKIKTIIGNLIGCTIKNLRKFCLKVPLMFLQKERKQLYQSDNQLLPFLMLYPDPV